MFKWVKGHHRQVFLSSQKVLQSLREDRETEASSLKRKTSKEASPAWTQGVEGGGEAGRGWRPSSKNPESNAAKSKNIAPK